MLWPNPSASFEQAVARQIGGSAWIPVSQSSSQHLYGAFEFSLMLYNSEEPKRRVNNVGETFGAEFHYISGSLPPNAYAFHDGESYCIGISITLFTLFEKIAFKLLSRPEISSIIYGRKKAWLEDLHGRLQEESPVGTGEIITFGQIDINDELIARYDEYLAWLLTKDVDDEHAPLCQNS